MNRIAPTRQRAVVSRGGAPQELRGGVAEATTKPKGSMAVAQELGGFSSGADVAVRAIPGSAHFLDLPELWGSVDFGFR